MNQEIIDRVSFAAWWVSYCDRLREIIVKGCCHVENRNRPQYWYLPMAVGVGMN